MNTITDQVKEWIKTHPEIKCHVCGKQLNIPYGTIVEVTADIKLCSDCAFRWRKVGIIK